MEWTLYLAFLFEKYPGLDLFYLVVGDHGHDLHVVAAARDEEGDASVLPDLLRVSLLLAPHSRPGGRQEKKRLNNSPNNISLKVLGVTAV